MKIEIWSDIICPFCYMGKRKLEHALKQFPDASRIEIEWKSYFLDPSIPKKMDKEISIYQYLADRKGITFEQSVNMHKNVVEAASRVGLTYNFDKAIVANTQDAHRLLHLAKKHGIQNEAKEKLLFSYFTDGKNIADTNTLIEIGKNLGIEENEVSSTLNSDKYKQEAMDDIYEAMQLGVRGVPFFVFDRKYAISGAQDTSLFFETITKAFLGWKEKVNQD